MDILSDSTGEVAEKELTEKDLGSGCSSVSFNTSDENIGILEMDDVTSDGFRVDIFGRWCDSGQVQRRSSR